jgi:hypothetical protein
VVLCMQDAVKHWAFVLHKCCCNLPSPAATAAAQLLQQVPAAAWQQLVSGTATYLGAAAGLSIRTTVLVVQAASSLLHLLQYAQTPSISAAAAAAGGQGAGQGAAAAGEAAGDVGQALEKAQQEVLAAVQLSLSQHLGPSLLDLVTYLPTSNSSSSIQPSPAAGVLNTPCGATTPLSTPPAAITPEAAATADGSAGGRGQGGGAWQQTSGAAGSVTPGALTPGVTSGSYMLQTPLPRHPQQAATSSSSPCTQVDGGSRGVAGGSSGRAALSQSDFALCMKAQDLVRGCLLTLTRCLGDTMGDTSDTNQSSSSGSSSSSSQAQWQAQLAWALSPDATGTPPTPTTFQHPQQLQGRQAGWLYVRLHQLLVLPAKASSRRSSMGGRSSSCTPPPATPTPSRPPAAAATPLVAAGGAVADPQVLGRAQEEGVVCSALQTWGVLVTALGWHMNGATGQALLTVGDDCGGCGGCVGCV